MIVLQSKVQALPGKRDGLVAKFLEAAELQRGNPACHLTYVATSPDDEVGVWLTEVWRSAKDHKAATQSPAVAKWAADMPQYVDRLAESAKLDYAGGTLALGR
jgi:quinol monooxygenase YgiN